MNKENANYESLEDSLMDLANYSLIAITEIKNERNKKKAQECRNLGCGEN